METIDPLTGIVRKRSRLHEWLLPTTTNTMHEEKSIRRWEWAVAYMAFSLILALNWLGEHLFPRWYNGKYERVSKTTEEMDKRAGEPR